jgi:hypothetical protein
MARSQKAVVVAITTALLAVIGVAGGFAMAAHPAGRHLAAADLGAAQLAPQPARAARGTQARPLPPLRKLTPPDAIVTLPAAATPRQLSRVRHLYGVKAVTVADQGTVTVARHRVRVLGLDLSARGFTPRYTATSRALWTSVARGELTVDFSLAGRMAQALGATVPVTGPSATPGTTIRVGAFATVGLGQVQALADRSLSPRLGLSVKRVLIVSAPDRSDSGLRSDLQWVLGPNAHVRLVRPPHIDQAVISAYARAVIPSGYLRLYRAAAATCRGLPWTVLAAIGTVETGNGSNTATSSKGAMGPMQFLPSTFVAYAVDGDGDGVANIQDPADAIYSAARYLCAWGAGLGGQSLYAAIFAYNHADWYVREVLRLAVAYS